MRIFVRFSSNYKLEIYAFDANIAGTNDKISILLNLIII